MSRIVRSYFQVNNSDINLEKAELEKQLEAKEQAERQQAELISKLQAMIVTSGSGHVTQEPPKVSYNGGNNIFYLRPEFLIYLFNGIYFLKIWLGGGNKNKCQKMLFRENKIFGRTCGTNK